MEKIPKYEYHVKTWGGFYDGQYSRIHGKEPGDFWFDTAVARDEYIKGLRAIESDLKARSLMVRLTEGYFCRIPTILHRVVEYGGKRYYTTFDMGMCYPFSHAKYHMDNKWYPGTNDYPLGEDFDYENNEVETIQEWITVAMDNSEAYF